LKPRLLDLFCGAGGAAMGYHRAGFEVVGVDIKSQPHYPFEFHQADAMTYPLDGFDAIHASPPCQAYSSLRHLGKGAGEGAPDLVAATRVRLMRSSTPWIMENVAGSPLLNPLTLCGTSFGLHAVAPDGVDRPLHRHRLFESSHLLFGQPCRHNGTSPIAVYGDHQRKKPDPSLRIKRAGLDSGREAMGIDWMPWRPLTQAIPPAYTEWLGRQLLAAIEREVAA
jgi:DNA (cytosine-5)-methyltransferase 1